MVVGNAVSDNITITVKANKKQLVKLLAIKLGYANVTQYLEARIDAEIAQYLTPDEIKRLGEPLPKDGSGRRARNQVAT